MKLDDTGSVTEHSTQPAEGKAANELPRKKLRSFIPLDRRAKPENLSALEQAGAKGFRRKVADGGLFMERDENPRTAAAAAEFVKNTSPTQVWAVQLKDSGLAVVDIDDPKSEIGKKLIKAFIASGTWGCRSGSVGYHFYIKETDFLRGIKGEPVITEQSKSVAELKRSWITAYRPHSDDMPFVEDTHEALELWRTLLVAAKPAKPKAGGARRASETITEKWVEDHVKYIREEYPKMEGGRHNAFRDLIDDVRGAAHGDVELAKQTIQTLRAEFAKVSPDDNAFDDDMLDSYWLDGYEERFPDKPAESRKVTIKAHSQHHNQIDKLAARLMNLHDDSDRSKRVLSEGLIKMLRLGCMPDGGAVEQQLRRAATSISADVFSKVLESAKTLLGEEAPDQASLEDLEYQVMEFDAEKWIRSRKKKVPRIARSLRIPTEEAMDLVKILSRHQERSGDKKLKTDYEGAILDIMPNLAYYPEPGNIKNPEDGGVYLNWNEEKGIWEVLEQWKIERLITRLIKLDSSVKGMAAVKEKKGIRQDLAGTLIRTTEVEIETENGVEVVERLITTMDIDLCDTMMLDAAGRAISFETGEFCDQDPDQPLMRRMNTVYRPEMVNEGFMHFLDQITLGRKDLQQYLQALFGSLLCPSNSMRNALLPTFRGVGANGKSLLFDLVEAVLGEQFVARVRFQPFLANAPDSELRSALMAMVGKRLVIGSEIPPVAKANANVFKDITGERSIKSRGLFKDEQRIPVTFKMFLQGNSMPQFGDQSLGIKRRFRVVPFDATFAEKDQDEYLFDKLTTPEGRSGILNWLFGGLKIWNDSKGKIQCDAVDRATAEYHENYDTPFSQWAEARLVPCGHGDEMVTLADAWRDYDAWCEKSGMFLEYESETDDGTRKGVKKQMGHTRSNFRKDMTSSIYTYEERKSRDGKSTQDYVINYRLRRPSDLDVLEGTEQQRHIRSAVYIEPGSTTPIEEPVAEPEPQAKQLNEPTPVEDLPPIEHQDEEIDFE